MSNSSRDSVLCTLTYVKNVYYVEKVFFLHSFSNNVGKSLFYIHVTLWQMVISMLFQKKTL